MSAHADKEKKDNSHSDANGASQKQSGNDSAFQFVDNRAESKAQAILQKTAAESPQQRQTAQMQAVVDSHAVHQPSVFQKKENKTGLPDNLKSGMENLSGISLDGVKVHQNSAKPAEVGAHAYAQGTDIHVAPGQMQHLPHEAWHVVQQAQGRVKPTTSVAGMAVNDSPSLEKEADVMGAKSLQMKAEAEADKQNKTIDAVSQVSQRLEGDDLVNLPALFSASNLQFTTKAAGRTPTFYFDDGAQTGRLRTDHTNGPAIYTDAYRRSHFFFPSKSLRATFKQNLADGQTLAEQEGTPATRTAGSFHYEVSIDATGKKQGVGHASGGKLVLNAGSFNDAQLKIIYNRINNNTDALKIPWDDLP